ncbi:hypothetical protein SORBI_3001G253000 [Sorghum bicolor]|uniref:Uncharacterized protein n=1 Tax=Sorghum bicolor TaxID=4558 RepID=A0A1B6QKW9_SORBI|nr:hypothetical protein SORBI_3001G253000 [Sorghum bicolor]
MADAVIRSGTTDAKVAASSRAGRGKLYHRLLCFKNDQLLANAICSTNQQSWSVVAAGVPCGANQPPGRARGQHLARLRGHQRRKVQQDEPKDLKCDQRRRCSKRNQKVRGFHFPDCSNEGGSCQVLEGDNQEDEPVEDEEVDSSDATIGSAAILVKSCNDPNMDQLVLVMEEQSIKIQLLHNRRPQKN